MQYQGVELERWLGRHAVFNYGPKVNASDTLWSEFQACLKFGLDPDTYFQKDRNSRIMITGGVIADSAIHSMRSYDVAKEHEMEAERKRKHKR